MRPRGLVEAWTSFTDRLEPETRENENGTGGLHLGEPEWMEAGSTKGLRGAAMIFVLIRSSLQTPKRNLLHHGEKEQNHNPISGVGISIVTQALQLKLTRGPFEAKFLFNIFIKFANLAHKGEMIATNSFAFHSLGCAESHIFLLLQHLSSLCC